MQAVIFTGIQAAGKSSFYQRHFADTHIRINLDMLRTRNRETILTLACIAAKQGFVSDNTNLTRACRAKIIELARAAHFEVIGYFFDTSLEDALRRNAQRPNPIPEAGMRGALSKLEPPCFEEGFDRLYCVRLSDDFIVTELTQGAMIHAD